MKTQTEILENAIELLTANLNTYDSSSALDRAYWTATTIHYCNFDRGRMDVTLWTDDEGGPSELTVFFDPPLFVPDREDLLSIRMMVHEFDTMLRVLQYEPHIDTILP